MTELTQACPKGAASANGHAAQSRVPAPTTLRGLFQTYRRRILVTYALFNLENLLRLAQPLVLGLAIDDLLRASYRGLGLLVAQLLGFLLVGCVRRMYDMRAFTTIYTDLATRLVQRQRGQAVGVSELAARSTLSRAFVDFFERDVPVVMQSLYYIGGALVMLALYDGPLVLLCLGLLVPAAVVNWLYGRRVLALTAGLNDQLEREVSVIGHGRPDEVREHYRRLARWRIRLADSEALSFGTMELFVLAVIAVALFRTCSLGADAAGTILAVLRYVLMFVMGLDGVPYLIQQVSRLRDVGRRLRGQAG
jgi:ABC-type multidrug transport system fused ATPase/permease subunit